MPGADQPLFTVEKGQMDFGLGIHGEPGISSAPWMPARELAARLVETVLAERPDGASGRVAVVLNGLGATKYEELFVLYGDVATLLGEAGLELVAPEVGELVTSLDMAGCSLSVTWLDEELEGFWAAPADTPAFKRGNAVATARTRPRRRVVEDLVEDEQEQASEASIAAAAVAKRAVAALHATVEEHKEQLGQLDAVAGDGDHGIGMSRGATAAAEAAEQTEGGVQSVLVAAGAAFGDKAGGTSGILWGLLLDGLGRSLGNTEPVTTARALEAVQQAVEKLQTFSKAERGDKTMLDAIFPFVETLTAEVEAGQSLAPAWQRAAEAAVRAADETASLTPRIGRARPLAERSIGTPDPGAVSLGMIVTAVGVVLAEGASPAR
jgi:dihydroxyacetone kinase